MPTAIIWNNNASPTTCTFRKNFKLFEQYRIFLQLTYGGKIYWSKLLWILYRASEIRIKNYHPVQI